MNELYVPISHIIKLQLQPDFPQEDLSDDNVEMLDFQLSKDEGLTAYAEQLQHHQRQIHLIADRALKVLGIKTRYAEGELFAFSHGFASFETINDLVHPPRLYNMQLARSRVEQLFVDTRSFFEIEFEELQRSLDENRDMLPVSHDRPAPELELANRHNILPNNHPNTYGVILKLGETRDESMAQLQARTAGAALAYSFQTEDLDAA